MRGLTAYDEAYTQSSNEQSMGQSKTAKDRKKRICHEGQILCYLSVLGYGISLTR